MTPKIKPRKKTKTNHKTNPNNKTKNKKTKNKKKAGAAIQPVENIVKINETPQGIPVEQFTNILTSIIHSNTPRRKIYLALGSAIHETNAYSKYQSLPNFLPRSEPTVVILYDDFLQSRNSIIFNDIPNYPNWTFLVIQRYPEYEDLNKIKTNTDILISTTMSILNRNNIHNWYIANYVAYRDPSPIERRIYTTIHNILKRLVEINPHENKDKIFQWNYRDTDHILSLSDQPTIKLRITPSRSTRSTR